MKKEKGLEAMEHIDPEMILEAEDYRGTNHRAAFHWGAIAACLCLAAAGLAVRFLPRQNVTAADESVPAVVISSSPVEHHVPQSTKVPDTDPDPAEVEPGIHIPAIDLPKPVSGEDGLQGEYDMIGLVVYKGGIYTQAENYLGADAERIAPLLGSYLGRAKGSINEWSTQDEYAEEFASNLEGEVYEVQGYDPGFRLCLRREVLDEHYEPQLFIEFLDRLNGINLDTGADLFEKRLRLRDRVAEVRFQSHDDWNECLGNIRAADLTDGSWDAFLDAVNSGTFVNTWDPNHMDPTIYNTESQAHLYLAMDDGTVVQLRLIEGGYVGYGALPWYFVQIPGEAFEAVFRACLG